METHCLEVSEWRLTPFPRKENRTAKGNGNLNTLRQTLKRRGREAKSVDLEKKQSFWDSGFPPASVSFRSFYPICTSFLFRLGLCSPNLKHSHAGVHCLHGPQPQEGEWGPQQAKRHQPQRGEPSPGQVSHRGHHRSQLRLLHSTPHFTEGVNRETHWHEVQVCVCVCVYNEWGIVTEGYVSWKTAVRLFDVCCTVLFMFLSVFLFSSSASFFFSHAAQILVRFAHIFVISDESLLLYKVKKF